MGRDPSRRISALPALPRIREVHFAQSLRVHPAEPRDEWSFHPAHWQGLTIGGFWWDGVSGS